MASSKIKVVIPKVVIPIVKETTASTTINANTNGRLTGTAPTVEGYTLVGIIGITSSAGAAGTITEFRLNDNGQPTSVVRNVSNAQISVSHTYTLLYLPS